MGCEVRVRAHVRYREDGAGCERISLLLVQMAQLRQTALSSAFERIFVLAPAVVGPADSVQFLLRKTGSCTSLAMRQSVPR